MIITETKKMYVSFTTLGELVEELNKWAQEYGFNKEVFLTPYDATDEWPNSLAIEVRREETEEEKIERQKKEKEWEKTLSWQLKELRKRIKEGK